jgi:anti-sigma factor ChrR (cupin superfamily)
MRRRSQPEEVPAEMLTSARRMAAAAEGSLAEVRREIGGASAEMTEIDRTLADKIAQRAGAQRRLDLIEELLRSVDTELKAVGATRDVTVLVELEGNTRRQREEAGSLRARGKSRRSPIPADGLAWRDRHWTSGGMRNTSRRRDTAASVKAIVARRQRSRSRWRIAAPQLGLETPAHRPHHACLASEDASYG